MSSKGFDFSGKTVLITGASYGFGEQFAHSFADAGADLILTARSTDLLNAVADACRAKGRKVTAVSGDVSIEDDVKRVMAAGLADHGRIDVLINNAGVADMRGLAPEHFDAATWNQIVSVDLTGAYFYLREVGRHMLESGGGSIVNICSIMSSGGSENSVIAYTAAKGGLLNLTKQLGCEWADRGVRVNAVSPGFVVTEMTRPALEALGISDYIASRTPMRRVGEIQEIVDPVMFLASDMASYITGIDMLVDGGTNAANGYWQIAPAHHYWNGDTTPPIPGGYKGYAQAPASLDVAKLGIPGIHYPMPDMA
jgi:NAD(P)-dependent dehydrogenase (short-subunit alcohol dehydrogenase family)